MKGKIRGLPKRIYKKDKSQKSNEVKIKVEEEENNNENEDIYNINKDSNNICSGHNNIQETEIKNSNLSINDEFTSTGNFNNLNDLNKCNEFNNDLNNDNIEETNYQHNLEIENETIK